MCNLADLKRGKIKCINGLMLLSWEVVKEIEQAGYKYLGTLKIEKPMEEEMNENFKVEYLRRHRFY